ncbi:hypothetical protein, partial [Burkholderia seminalis]
IGTGVIGGMITATFLAIFMIPMFFVRVRAIFSGETENVDDAWRLVQGDLQRGHDDAHDSKGR